MKLLLIILIFSLGCQSSNILVIQDGRPAVELKCKNFGDTQLNLDYENIRITCYGGKLSTQASELVTDVFSAIISAIVPVSAISAGFNALFGEDKKDE